jgi:acetyl esterase
VIDPRVVPFCAPPASNPALDIAQWRRDNDAIGIERGGEPVSVQATQDSTIAARDGHAIPIRIYSPQGLTNDSPVVIYAHGGGWVIGSIAGSDRVTRALAHDMNAVVVSVDYRMAPEAPFPAAIHDLEDVVHGLIAQPGSFNWAGRKFVLSGDSAGAHLALQLAYQMLDANKVNPSSKLAAAVLAIYPCLNPACDSTTMHEYANGHGLSRDGMKWYWQQYLAGAAPSSVHTPWLRLDLSGLCPTWIVTAQYDVLRAEAQEFALRLMQAGVTTTLSMQPGMLHGFVRWRGVVPHASRALAQGCAWVNSALRDQLHP